MKKVASTWAADVDFFVPTKLQYKFSHSADARVHGLEHGMPIFISQRWPPSAGSKLASMKKVRSIPASPSHKVSSSTPSRVVRVWEIFLVELLAFTLAALVKERCIPSSSARSGNSSSDGRIREDRSVELGPDHFDYFRVLLQVADLCRLVAIHLDDLHSSFATATPGAARPTSQARKFWLVSRPTETPVTLLPPLLSLSSHQMYES